MGRRETHDCKWTSGRGIHGVRNHVPAILVCFFAARRWSPLLAQRSVGLPMPLRGLGLPAGAWLLLGGQSWRLYMGPLLMAAWALFGAVVDLWRPREWRWPIVWRVFVPYLALYFWAEMFLWWPLWDINRVAWAVSSCCSLRTPR